MIVAWWLLCVVRCVRFVVHCLLSVAFYVLCDVCCALVGGCCGAVCALLVVCTVLLGGWFVMDVACCLAMLVDW